MWEDNAFIDEQCCSCEGCTCDPCECSDGDPCGCNDDLVAPI